ncbi:MAG: recombinase family protein [Chitinophagaceae bacterium]|nr:recombinase family protein [Chitinophagaceae bacterium]
METQTPTKNAVIYCRVSTKEQVEEGNSLITQEKHCREYASKHSYSVAQVFIEQGESAKTADRTELRKLLSYCAIKKNDIHAIIIYKIDRLSRNIDDYSQIRINLKRYGVEIKSTSEFFENSPAGRFMENILANVAQFDNDVRTERCVGGMKQAIQEGRYVWCAPIGYSNEKLFGKSNIVPNAKAPLIVNTFQEVSKGLYSVNEVRIRMAKAGLTQKDGRPLAKSRFYHLLKNEIYTGWITTLGERVRGSFEPLISEELFRQVQRRIKTKKTARTYLIENPDFPLRRFVVAPTGEKLTGSWCQGKRNKYAYYRFLKSKQEFKKASLEERFLLFLKQYALPEALFRKLVNFVNTEMANSSEKVRNIINELIQKRAQLQQRKQLLIEKNLNGVISDTILKEQLEHIEDELWNTHEALESNKNQSIAPAKIIDQLQDFFTDPGGFWRKQPFHIKKMLQKFEFPKGIVFDGETFRTPEICSIFKLNEFFLANKFCNVDYPVPSYEHEYSTNFSVLSDKEILAQLKTITPALTELDNIINTPKEEVEKNGCIVRDFSLREVRVTPKLYEYTQGRS